MTYRDSWGRACGWVGTASPPTIHITHVRHVASCALYLCTCLITGPLRPDTATAQQDADNHTRTTQETPA